MSDDQVRCLCESIETAALAIATAILMHSQMNLDDVTLDPGQVRTARLIMRDAKTTVKAGNK